MLQRHADAALRVFTLVAVLALGAAGAQNRNDAFDVADVRVTEVVLTPELDGGCSARFCGEVESTDGGVKVAACSPLIQLVAPLNQNRCAALATAGVNRVARELRFSVDAGAP